MLSTGRAPSSEVWVIVSAQQVSSPMGMAALQASSTCVAHTRQHAEAETRMVLSPAKSKHKFNQLLSTKTSKANLSIYYIVKFTYFASLINSCTSDGDFEWRSKEQDGIVTVTFCW